MFINSQQVDALSLASVVLSDGVLTTEERSQNRITTIHFRPSSLE